MEVFGRYVATTMVMILLFLVPAMNYSGKVQRIRRNYAEMLKKDFIEQVMQTEEIVLTEWEEFHEKISGLGEQYTISLSVGIRKTIGDEGDKNLNGIYELRYEKEIMEELYRSGRYLLKKGEYVMMEVSMLHQVGTLKRWMGAEEL